RLAERPNDLITTAEIEAEAGRWANRQPKPPMMQVVRNAWRQFHGNAIRWLTFLGRLQIPAPAPPPCPHRGAPFPEHIVRQRRLSVASVDNYCRTVNDFLARLDEAGLRLDTLTVAQVDDLLVGKVRDYGYSRVTIRSYATTLRAFFRYAGQRGWCGAN